MNKQIRANADTIWGRLLARNESLDRALQHTLARLAPAEVLARLPEAATRRQDSERMAAVRAHLEAQLASAAPEVSWEELSRPSLEDLSRGARLPLRA